MLDTSIWKIKLKAGNPYDYTVNVEDEATGKTTRTISITTNVEFLFKELICIVIKDRDNLLMMSDLDDIKKLQKTTDIINGC